MICLLKLFLLPDAFLVNIVIQRPDKGFRKPEIPSMSYRVLKDFVKTGRLNDSKKFSQRKFA
jgi:hypothetical protein